MDPLKRVACAYAAAILLLIPSGCSGSEAGSAEADYQDHEDSISASLSGDVPATLISVSEDSGAFSLDVSIGPSGEISSFGNYVLAVKEAFEAEFPAEARGDFDVSMAIQGSTPALIRYSSDDYSEMDGGLSGLLSDNRSGEVVFTNISDLDDLAEAFPAVSIYADEHGYGE